MRDKRSLRKGLPLVQMYSNQEQKNDMVCLEHINCNKAFATIVMYLQLNESVNAFLIYLNTKNNKDYTEHVQ